MNKRENELVTIIVPIYNVEKYLDKCLDSIRKQTYTKYEVIIVNDGSEDKSRSIAEKYQKVDSRFFLFDKENGGLSSARNYGLNHTNGKYVAFVDSDDFLSDKYIEMMIKTFDDDTDIVIGDYAVYNEERDKICYHRNQLKDMEFKTKDDKNKLVHYLLYGPYQVMPVWKNMYRTHFLNVNCLRFTSERQVYAEDALFHVEAYVKARKVKMISNILFFHLVRKGSLSQKYRNNFFDMQKELHFRIKSLLERFCSTYMVEEYDQYFVSAIGASILNMCKCSFIQARKNVKNIFEDPIVKNYYMKHYRKCGYTRYWILYKSGYIKSAFFSVVIAKVMLAFEPIYRRVQHKDFFNKNMKTK